ncbi:MAG: chromosomal protein MC1 [Candidatus Aenigmarchaeota archaeon]|nr:chromosomal protein MC1 [Candidatus Aenigmarchaeota archaeon]
MAKRKRTERKYYVLRKGNRTSIFTGRSPRQAALKAATRGVGDIKLRERGRRNKDGTYTIHIFKGSVRTVSAPENRPEWLPARVKKPVVQKVGVERVRRL